PRFIKDTDGSLLFTYRDGRSGNGSNLYNHYNETTKSWTRLLDRPLFDGRRPSGIPRPSHDTDDMMNAYPDPDCPLRGPDGFWHLSWIWRDTPAAETNHDLSYARSRDLRHWETMDGHPLTLPLSLQTPGVILDPVPANGGIINGSGKPGFDDKGRVIIAYHKFDDKGATQLYLARAENGAWNTRQITRWTYRWEPRGNGAIPYDIGHSGVRHDPALGLYISIRNACHDNGGWNAWKLDPDTLEPGEKIPAAQVPGYIPPELGHGVRAPLGMRRAADTGTAPSGLRYLLRWETLPLNRDQPREGPPPAPSQLELIVLETLAPATPPAR
ncbi:MAG: BNR repeat-containing protein, partial [Opitutaceae bacterium]|nr:BNR repeat-containing protein [Opitutaceae bacterium]